MSTGGDYVPALLVVGAVVTTTMAAHLAPPATVPGKNDITEVEFTTMAKPWIEGTQFRKTLATRYESDIRDAYAIAVEKGMEDPVVIFGESDDPRIMEIVHITNAPTAPPGCYGLFAISKNLIASYWQNKSPGSMERSPWEDHFPALIFAQGGCLIAGLSK